MLIIIKSLKILFSHSFILSHKLIYPTKNNIYEYFLTVN